MTMDFKDSPNDAAYRASAQNWMAENAPHHLLDELQSAPFFTLALAREDPIAAARAWQRKKAEGGYAAIHWPKEFGGASASPIQRVIWNQEQGAYAKLDLPFSIGTGMVGPTLMSFATENQKRDFLPKIASGEEIWCQLFSEPGAGSDLAGIFTRAERDGDDWVINGQKVWTSFAQYADYGLLFARSDFSAPKHKGLTMFFIDMKSPGVEVRPIRQMNEGSTFNEVYLTDVRIPDSNRLGGVGQGWKVSINTLMHERMSAFSTPTGFEELFKLCRTMDGPNGHPIDDPVVRSKLARWAALSSGLRYSYYRSVTKLARGEPPGPEASIGKLAAAGAMQQITRYALELQGEEATVMAPEPGLGDGWFQSMFLRATALRIEAGSDEILRNIIAERVLGLPGEPHSDKDIPFNKRKRS